MDNKVWLIVVVVVFIVAVIVVKRLRSGAQRKKAAAFASSRGWTYAARDDSLGARYPELFPLGAGHSRSHLNVLGFEAAGCRAESFDYQYLEEDTSSSSDASSTTTKRFHVVGLRIPHPLPTLEVARRSKLGSLAHGPGRRIEFESTEFNSRWQVQGEHPPAAHDLVHPGMMEWLLARQDRLPLALQDDHLFTFASGTQKLENIDQMVAVLTGFLERVPQHAWQKAQGEYPRPARHRTTSDLGAFIRAAKDARRG